MNHAFRGVFAPLVTVFDTDEKILLDAIARNVCKYNSTALKGYMPLGSNGEFQGLQDRESLAILETVANHKVPEKIIVGGCGRESVGKTVAFIHDAVSAGLDYAFILPPHYFVKQMKSEGLLRYYFAVADRSPIPIVVYNAPKFSAGIDLPPDFVRQLAQHPNICALKNSSPTPNTVYMQAIADLDFVLLAGNINTFYSGLCAGAEGCVLSTASYLPEYCCQLFDLFCSGRQEEAYQLSERLGALSKSSVGPLGVVGVKAAMTIRGFEGGTARLPLLDVSPEQMAFLRETLQNYQIPPFPTRLNT